MAVLHAIGVLDVISRAMLTALAVGNQVNRGYLIFSDISNNRIWKWEVSIGIVQRTFLAIRAPLSLGRYVDLFESDSACVGIELVPRPDCVPRLAVS